MKQNEIKFIELIISLQLNIRNSVDFYSFPTPCLSSRSKTIFLNSMYHI